MEEITVAGSIGLDSVDFSMLSLFLRADFVVKSVIIILILASLYSWTIIVAKLIRIKQLKKLEKEFEEIFWSGNSFEDLYETLNFNKHDPKSRIFCAAIAEWKKSKSKSAYIPGKPCNEYSTNTIVGLASKLRCIKNK